MVSQGQHRAMAILTDPARELYDVAAELHHGDSRAGAAYIGARLDVEPWSADFMRIITHVVEQADLAAKIVAESEAFDEDLKEEAASDLALFKTAFAGKSLVLAWDQGDGGGLQIIAKHMPRVRYLSSEVRRAVCYPKLTEDEAEELVSLIEEYLAMLADDPDVPAFARVAISAGLRDFTLRLTKLKWAGAAYTLAGFRDLRMLCHGLAQEEQCATQLQSAVWLRGFGSILAKFKNATESAKGYTDALAYGHGVYAIAAPLLHLPALPSLPDLGS